MFNETRDVYLQYKIELYLAGMEDGPPSSVTPTKRLEMLRAHQAAWKTLSWTAEETIPRLSGDSWDFFGGILAQANGPSSIRCRQLPSLLRGIKSQEWEVKFSPIKFRDFSIDPSQDLLVVIQIQDLILFSVIWCHVLSLTTGKPHQSASYSTIRLSGKHRWCEKVRISASFVGLVLERIIGGNSVAFYNWKTGECVMVFRSSSNLEAQIIYTEHWTGFGCHFTRNFRVHYGPSRYAGLRSDGFNGC